MKKDSKYFEEKFELSLKISKDFDSVYELGYTLVDLQALINSCNYVFFEEREYKSLPVTSRKFASKYKDELIIKDYRKGSFWAALGVSVLSGIILIFVNKYLIKTSNLNNNINININNNHPFSIKAESEEFKQRLHSIVERTEIIPGDPNQSTINLIHTINNSGILGEENIQINDKGIKTISNSIERFENSIK